MSDRAKASITAYSWPGNVRELSNVIERAVLLQAGRMIEPDDLVLAPLTAPERVIHTTDSDGTLAIDLSKGIVLEDLERMIIERVLSQTGWNRAKAAQLLGLSRETLRYRIEKHNLKSPASAGEL